MTFCAFSVPDNGVTIRDIRAYLQEFVIIFYYVFMQPSADLDGQMKSSRLKLNLAKTNIMYLGLKYSSA